MSGIVDTNIIVRYCLGSPPELAEAVAEILTFDEELWLPSVVIAEVAYVLGSVYQVPRELIVDNLMGIIQRKNVKPLELDKATALQALRLCRGSGRVSFADAMVWAAAQASGVGVVYSFDERFPADGIEVRGKA
jgi:predicted nucleic acid-binding protein